MATAELLVHLPLLLLLWVPIGLYYWGLYIATYWKRQNMPHLPALPFVGNFKDIMLFRRCIGEKIYDFYNDPSVKNTSVFGLHVFYKPAVLVRDPELIKRILVKDFNSFSNRYSNSNLHTDAIGSRTLFFIRNPFWRTLRPKLSPVFSSGRMKKMFYLMNEVGLELDEKLLSMTSDKIRSIGTDVKDSVARYTTDVIASCAFGVRANSLKDPNSEFKKHGHRIFDFSSYSRSVEFTSIFFFPELVSFFKFKAFTGQTSEFLRKSIMYVLAERQSSNTVRNDLIDTLIEIKNDDEKKVFEDNDVVVRDDVIIAQALSFFTAGFEMSSSIIAFGLFELAKQPKLQKRLRAEIHATLAANKGELTYDSVNGMKYLNMVTSEALRMYPILPFLDRRCNEAKGYSLEPYNDYKIPDGMQVLIPTYALHRDPQYYPNPDHFDPERFAPENRDKLVPYTYIPFGSGPHNCIGERFGVIQTKIGFVHFLKNHTVAPSAQTPKRMAFEKKSLIIQAANGVHLNLIRDPMIV